MAKSLDAKTIDTIADSLQSTKNITKADFEKSLDILEAAGKKADSGKTILSTLNSVDARRVTDLAAKYGDNVLKAVEKAGPKNIENILNILTKLDEKQASNFLEFLLKHDDVLIHNLKSPKGLTGTKFEDYLVEIFGGQEASKLVPGSLMDVWEINGGRQNLEIIGI